MAYIGGALRGTFARPDEAKRQAVLRARRSSGVDPSALAAIQRAKEQYLPGGGYGVGIEAGLERGRKKAIATGMQHLVGAGFAGTTMAGGLGLRYEEEVAAPTRLALEERRAQAISGIEMQQAGITQQARESTALRELQLYLATLREGTGGPTISGRVSQTGGPSYIASRQPTPDVKRVTIPGLGPTTMGPQYAKRFPSIYGEAEQQAPSLM